MASADFSTSPYTYAMVENDTLLDNFTLHMEDHVYKVHPFEAIRATEKRDVFAFPKLKWRDVNVRLRVDVYRYR